MKFKYLGKNDNWSKDREGKVACIGATDAHGAFSIYGPYGGEFSITTWCDYKIIEDKTRSGKGFTEYKVAKTKGEEHEVV